MDKLHNEVFSYMYFNYHKRVNFKLLVTDMVGCMAQLRDSSAMVTRRIGMENTECSIRVVDCFIRVFNNLNL